MTSPSRTIAWLSCAACCVLAGCCLAPKSRNACADCVSSAIAEVPNTYENYTPPQLAPVPAPGVELPPSPDDQPIPPPPSTRTEPNEEIDFFEPANANRSQTDTR